MGAKVAIRYTGRKVEKIEIETTKTEPKKLAPKKGEGKKDHKGD